MASRLGHARVAAGSAVSETQSLPSGSASRPKSNYRGTRVPCYAPRAPRLSDMTASAEARCHRLGDAKITQGTTTGVERTRSPRRCQAQSYCLWTRVPYKCRMRLNFNYGGAEARVQALETPTMPLVTRQRTHSLEMAPVTPSSTSEGTGVPCAPRLQAWPTHTLAAQTSTGYALDRPKCLLLPHVSRELAKNVILSRPGVHSYLSS